MYYWVYILRSCTGERYYVGSTDELEKRIAEHNGPHARWTKRFQPWVLVHSERFATRGEAMTRERQLKSLKGIGRHLEAVQRGDV